MVGSGNVMVVAVRLARSRAYTNTPSGVDRIIFSSIVIRIEELLEPLQELKVVLKPALDQLVHGYNLQFVRKPQTVCWFGFELALII